MARKTKGHPLSSNARRKLIREAMQRRVALALLAGAARATEAGSKPLSLREIQSEVNAVRADRRAK